MVGDLNLPDDEVGLAAALAGDPDAFRELPDNTGEAIAASWQKHSPTRPARRIPLPHAWYARSAAVRPSSAMPSAVPALSRATRCWRKASAV